MNDTIKKLDDLFKSGDIKKETLEMSLVNCHAEGLFSLVLNGEPGTLTRVFIATESIRMGDVALHSHKYMLTITPLTVGLTHHKVVPGYDLKAPMYLYDSDKKELTFKHMKAYSLKSYALPLGSSATFDAEQIHTISCAKNTMWVVEEKKFHPLSKITKVLGMPFDVPDTFYNRPTESEITHFYNVVKYQVMALMAKFSRVNKNRTTSSIAS